jgi:hypothetical protein
VETVESEVRCTGNLKTATRCFPVQELRWTLAAKERVQHALLHCPGEGIHALGWHDRHCEAFVGMRGRLVKYQIWCFDPWCVKFGTCATRRRGEGGCLGKSSPRHHPVGHFKCRTQKGTLRVLSQGLGCPKLPKYRLPIGRGGTKII